MEAWRHGGEYKQGECREGRDILVQRRCGFYRATDRDVRRKREIERGGRAGPIRIVIVL